MNTFKTPAEAIQACDQACEQEWTALAVILKLDQSKDPTTYNATRSIFLGGYMAGAKWVTGTIVDRMMTHAADKQPKA